MSRIDNPDARGLDPERYWMVSRTAVIEEYYFDNEREACEFAKARGRGFVVQPPEPAALTRITKAKP